MDSDTTDESDSENEKPKNEDQLQIKYNNWYTKKYPRTVSCGTPYAYLGPRTAAKVKAKGYKKGYPDYVEHDPRLLIKSEEDCVMIKFYPGKVNEFKTPTGKGRTSVYQADVLNNLWNRGYYSGTCNNLDKAKLATKKYKECIPYFRGWIKIDLITGKVEIPIFKPQNDTRESPDSHKIKRRQKRSLKKTKKLKVKIRKK